MATEAEIIPEPISLVKTDEESKHLTLELCEEFLPGDLKKFQGELTQPAETDECLAKAENMQVASNNGVETMNAVSEGNPEISKGESFLISPEISKVDNETCRMSEPSEVDDTQFKAEKMPEDEEKMVNDKKFQLEEEVGTGENEAKEATEDRMEKGNTDHSIEELNLDIGAEKRMEVEVIADQDSSQEEKCRSIEEETSHSHESEHEETKTDENADSIESDKQVLGVQEATLELKKQALIDTPDPTTDSLKEAHETVTEASNSNLLQEELEEKSFKEVKDTEPEKLPALVGKEEGTEATEPIEISGSEKDQIIPDSIGDTLTSTVAESSEIKDHETTSEISEVSKKELHNPFEEVACVHEPTPEVDEKLEEVSSIIIKDESQAIESSEEIKDITGENDGIQDKNVLDASSVMKTKELCLQEVDNHDMCNIASDIRTENTVEESSTEESGQSKINEKTEQDLGTSSDICKDYANSESEKVGVEAKVLQVTDKERGMTEASDEMKRDEEPTVPTPEGNISEVESIDVVQQSQEGKPENKEILKESFQQQNEPEKEKLACPLNAVYKDVNTSISSENAEASTSIREVISIKDHEERFEGEGMEDTPTNTDAVSKDAESKEKDLQIEVNENTETEEVEISNKNAYDFHVADSLVGQSVEKENEKQYEFSDFQPEEQVHETNGASKEKDENSEDISDALQSRNSTNSEHIFTEAAATTDLKSETSEMDKENVKEVYLLDSEKCSESNETLENKEEGIQKVLEDCTAEKPEPEDAMKSIEDNSKQEETKEVCEGPKSIIKEKCAIIDESMKSTEEEMHERFQDEKEETPEVEVCEKLEINTVEDAEKRILEEEDTKDQTTLMVENMEEKSKEENTGAIMSIKEVCKESETAASGSGKENPEMEDIPIADISNSSISDETVKESIKEDESSPMTLIEEASNSNIEETDSTEETTLQNLEETAEPNNDPSLLDTEKESKEEITAIEAKEDLVRSSSFELEESRKDTEEETSVKGSINTADLDSASPAAEMEETNIKETEPEEKNKEINNVLAIEENGLATTEHEGIGVDSANNDVRPANDSTSCEKVKEIPQEEDGMQDKVPNAGSEDQMEMTTREIPLREILGDEVKEYSNMPSEEYEPKPIEERKITDETSEKDHAPEEHSETPVSQATDEILLQKEDNPTLDVPRAESEDTGKESGHEVKEHLAEEPYVHTEQESRKCSSVSDVINFSKGEEPRELENESDTCKAKTLPDEQSSDIVLEREKVEDGKPLDEATDVGETSGTCNDREKAIQEEENLAKNLAKPESLKEDTEVEKEETELPRGAHDQIPEVINVNDNAKNVELALAGFEEKPKSDSEPVVEDQSKETLPKSSESQADETSSDVQNQETEKQITEELVDKVDNEDYVNREQNANEVTKAVILSEEVDKEVERADDSEDIKEHVLEEESSTNELHPESKGDETTNEVEDYISVSTECLREADSYKQKEARKSEVEEHLTKDREESLVIKESEARRQDQESGDPVSVQGEDKESDEKSVDTVDESKLCQDKSEDEAVTKVRAETSLNNTEMDEVLVNTSNIISSETTESDANQETKELQLEEISSDLAPPVPANDNDEVEKQSLNVEIVDKDEAEVIKRDLNAVHLSMDQTDEAEKNLTAEKVDQLANNNHELVETKSEASKTSNADELGKIELALDGDHVSEDKGIEQDVETKKSLTAEELEANEVEETKGVPETSFDYLSQRVETIVEDDISSHNILPQQKPEEQLQTSASTLPSEDEEIRTPNSIEKIEEEIQKDAGIIKHESLEDSSYTKTIADICLQKEEQREPKAREETVVDQGPQKEEPEKQIQTTYSALPSEEREDAAEAVSEEIDFVTGDGKTGDQTLSANNPEEGTTSFALLSKEQEEETTRTVEKKDKEKINEAEIPEDKISEDSSGVEKITEIFLEKEEFQELEDAKKDETAAAQAIQVEEPKEQSLTSALSSEDIESGNTANKEEEEKVKEVEMLEKEISSEKERPHEPEAVADQETTVAKVSITEESVEIETLGTIEKLDQDKRKEAENLEDEICEESSTRETEGIFLQKEEPNELHAVPKEGITSGQTFSEEQSEEQLHISKSAVTSEELEHETKKIEDEETNKEETIEDEISEDASDAKTTEEVCSRKERSIELDNVVEDEMTAGHTLTEKKSEEQVQNPTSALPSKEVEGGTTSTTEKIESEKIEEAELLQDDNGEDVTLQKEQLQETDFTEETTLLNIEETAEPDNVPSLLDIENQSKEAKVVLVCSSSFEPEESKKDTEEETSVKGSIDTEDLDSASPAAETEETNIKEDEAEEKKKEINNVFAVEENCLATTEQEGVGVDSADNDVKPADSSISCEKVKEIPQEEDRMQENVPNAGSEDHMEMTTREIPLKEILGDEVKEYSNMPSEEYEPTPIEERKITDETSEKDHAPEEHSETPASQATEETLKQKEDNPTLDVPRAESEDTGKESGHEVKKHLAEEPYVHTEQESGNCSSVSEVTNVSNGEEPRELDNESDACKAKTLPDEESSDIVLEREKVEDGKTLNEAMDAGETSDTCNDSEKAIQEEENLAKNLAKPESLKEDTEEEKEAKLPGGAHDQTLEIINVNDNAKNVELEIAGFEEKPKSDSEPVVEDQSKETFPEPSKSQADETSNDVQNQETEKQITEELDDKVDNEDYINREQNANEVTKAVILTEEVDKEVEKADDSENIKEYVIEEESSTNELHPESKRDGTTNEVEGYTSVSTECLKEADSNKQIEATKSEVEEHSAKDREASLVIKESGERRQDEESADPASLQGKVKEPEEKIEDIVDESKHFQDKSDIEAVIKVRADTSLNNTEVYEELVNTSNISSETTESDANQETKELQVEEISSDLAPPVPSNDNDEVEKKSLNMETVDKDEFEVIKRDPDAVHLSNDQIDEAEKSLTVDKEDQFPKNDHELVETKSDASKTSIADELGKIELASDGDHVYEDKCIEQDVETKKSLTVEELEENEVEETKGVPETSFDYLPQRVETIVEDDISSHNTLPQQKPEEQLQTSASTLLSEDEEIITPNSTEKIEEEIQKEAGIIKHESLEDSSDTKTKEDICLQKEEQRETKAISEEETVVDQDLQKEEPEKQIQTTYSTFPSEEREDAAGAVSEGIDVVTGNGKTSDQTLSANKPEEGTTSFALLSNEQEEETTSTVEKIDEEKINEAEIPEDKISEDSPDAKKAAEICLVKEEFQELEDAKNDETAADQAIQVEEPKEQSLSSALRSENIEHGTIANEEEDEKVKEVEMLERETFLEKEKPQEPEAVVDQETTTSTLPPEYEEIRTPNSIEKIEEKIQKDAGIVKHESLEDSSDTKTKEEVCLPKEEQKEPKAVSEEETFVDQGLQKEEPEKQIQTTSSTFPSDEREDVAGAISEEIDVVTGDGITGEQTPSANKPKQGTTSFALLSKEQEEETIRTVEKIEEEKINEAEITEDKSSEDSSDAKKTAEVCLEKEEFQELEDAKKDETAAARAIQVEEPKEQSLTSALPSENIEHGSTANEEEEKVKEVEILEKEICLEKERPQEPEAVLDQETTVTQASKSEESVEIETIGTFEKLDEEKRKEAENLEDEICEDSSTRETEDTCLQKEEPNELHAVSTERITSDQTFSEEQPDEQLHISTCAITSEELEHESKKREDEVTNKEETIKDESSENAADARTTEEISSPKERSFEIEVVLEDEMTAGHTITEKKSEEQVHYPTSALPSKEEAGGNTSTTEKKESEKLEEAEFLQDDNEEDVLLQKVQLQQDEALAKDENASSHPTEKSEEQIPNPVATLPSEEHKHETVNEVDKTEEEKVKEEEVRNEDSDGAKTVVETRGPHAVLEGETIASQVIEQESEERKIEEEETLEDDKSPQSECVRELQGALEDGATATQTLTGENQPDQLHITTSTMPSEEQEDETKETKVQEEESPEKIPEQTREIEEASNVKMETSDNAFDYELLTESEDAAIEEKFVKASDETEGEENQFEKTNEGNEIIANEVSKEEVIEDKEVTETSYSTFHSEEQAKDGSGEDELKDKVIEDKRNEALEITCQIEQLLVEVQKSTENDIIEKQIVCDDKTVEDPDQASVTGIETTTVTEEESSIELSQPEGTKDLAEGNQIIDDIQQPEERTNIASDKQIPKELDPIENTEITSSISKENALIDLQDRVAESSQKAEVGDAKEIYTEVEDDHSGEKITDNSGEDITKESSSVEDWTKVSSSEHVKSSAMETLQVTQDMSEEREAKDETGSAQILLVEKPEEQSPAPSSTLPSKEGKHGVSTQVDAVEEKELKEVEILEKDSYNTKTREEICLENEENKELKAVVEQESIAAQAPSTEITEDPVSNFEDERKEEQVQNPTSAPLSKEGEGGNTSTTEKIEREKVEEAEFLQVDNGEDVSLQKERLQEDEALAKDENASSQTLQTVKSEEQIPNPVDTLHSEERKHETVNKVDKTEEEKVKEEEMQNEDSDGPITVVEIYSEKDETREPQAVLEGETFASQIIAQESEEKKIEEEETLEDDKSLQSECVRVLQGTLEDGATAAQTLSGENQPAKLHITTSTLPYEEQEDRTKETKVQEYESPEKILEQTREIEEASNVKMETRDNAFDNELLTESEDDAIKEKLDKAKEETAGEESQCEKTNEGNEIIPNEVSKEEVIEDNEVSETSYSISHSEELTKDGSGEDELEDKVIEDKINEALEITCQNEQLLVEAQKSTENDITEKQIVCEDKTVEDPGQASVARTETTTVTEEESSIELSQAEGTKDLAEGNQIIDDIQEPEVASDKQIPRELDPIENTEITGSISKKHAPMDLQDRVAESSQKAEEESSIELSQPEGSKDLAEGNQIIDDIQQPEERTNIASDKQIPRELDPIENTEITSSIGKEHAPIDLQDKVAESSKKAEVGDAKEISPKEAKADHSGEKITDNSGEDITKDSTSVEDWTMVSSSDHIESPTKETLQVTQDMIEEREAKDETGGGQIHLVEKPEEQSPAPSSKLSEAGEHGVSTQVDAVEEKELKEVEILDKDSSDTKTREEICLEKEENKELKADVEQETIVVQAPPTEIKEDQVSHFEDGRKEEQVQNPTSALPTKEEECGGTSTTEKIESEKIEEAEFLRDNGEDVSMQKEQLQEDEALAKDENASSQTLPTEKSEEKITNPVATLPSEEHKHETVNEVDKTEEEKVKEEEMRNEDSDGAKTVVEICSEKDEIRVPQAVLEGETIRSQVIAQESEEKKIEEEETLEGGKSPQSERVRELQGALEDGATAAQTLSGENQPDKLHITTYTTPSEEQEDETKEKEVQEDESPEKIPEQTRETEEASNVKMATREKAFDNELLTESEAAAIEEKFVKASDETAGEENQCEKTNEGNEIILNVVSKEEVIEDEEVNETSYSTSHSEELTKDGSGEDELKDKLIEDMTNEALETTCQNEELLVEVQNSTENDIIEKQIVCEDKTVEDPGQASVARIETATVTEEESSMELSQPEGSKDLAEGNQIIEDIQQPDKRTNIASDKQIPRELDPIENTEITSSIGKEHAPIDLQDKVAESPKKAEVGDAKEISPKEAEVDHSGEKIKDNSGEDITKESTSVEDWTMVSASDHVESTTKETMQVAQDMIEEREAKDETGGGQIHLVEKPEEQSPAPSSKLSEAGEHGVSTQVDAVEEKVLKEVEILDKDSTDTKTREEICLEKEENKELKAVVEQETIVVQAPPTEIKEDPVSHFEDGRKEEQVQNPTSAPSSKEEEGGNTSTTEKIESEKIEEAKFLQDDNGEDVSLQKERLQEDQALAKDENASSQTLPKEKSEEQIPNPVATLPSEEHKHETVSEVDKTEEEKVKEEEMRNEDSDGAKTVVEICSKKDETRGTQAVLEGETIASQVIAQESEEKRIEEEETLEDDKSPQSECVRELQGALEYGATAAQTLSGENQPDQLHITTFSMPSEEQEDETKEKEVQEDESPEKIPEQTRKIEEASNVKMETREKAFNNEFLTESEDAAIEEKFVKASDETAGEENQCEKTNEGNEIILNEVSKEEIKEDPVSHFEDGRKEEQVQNPTSAPPSKEEEGGNTSTTEKIESEKIEEAEFLQDDNGEDVSLQKERLQEDEALAKDENASYQALLTVKSEEQITNPVATLLSEEHKHETVNEVDKTEEEKVKEEETQNEDSDGSKTVVEISSEKDETRGPQAVLEEETIARHVIAQESEEKKIEEEETLEDDKSPQSECVRELQDALEDGATAGQTLSGENQPEKLHITTSTLPSEEQEDETQETKVQEDESPEKILEQTREVEEASNVKMETRENAFDNELLTESEDAAIQEKLDKARDETAGEESQREKTNEGNEIILNEVSKEEVNEDEEVTETSYSTSHSEELTKDGYGEDELKDKLIEDKTNEALETTCQNAELLVEVQKSTEINIIEKHIGEAKTVEDPGQASVAMIETATVTEEESSIELSQAEGSKDIAEGNQIIDDIQQPKERTNIASDKQIPRELDPIENTEITSSIGKEHAPIDLQDRVAESSQKAEVEDAKEISPKEAEVDHSGEKITDNSGEDITKESTSVEDWTMVSSSDHVESSTKETLQVTQDMIEEKEAIDESDASQILLVEKPEEQSPAPSFKLPSEEGEHGVSIQVDAVEEKELKEVEILDNDSSDTKTREEICLEKEENKELKAVVEQETIAVQAPSTEIKGDPVSHFEDELQDKHTGDKKNETLKVPTYEIQNEELSMDTLKDGTNNNIEKEIVAEDETVKDLEQAPVGMKDATKSREEIPGEADPIESRTRSSIGKEHFPTEQQDRALETSDKAEVDDLEPGNAQEICSEAVVDHREEQKTDNSGVEITQEPALADSAKLSLSDLLQRSTREKKQVSEHVIEERELTVSKEEPYVEEAETIQVKEAKTEEKNEGEEGDEHNKTDSGSDAPVMVEAPRDTDTKPHKKSHNILSGVGSKVKHSISKVRKAITGKSSHSKEPKPISPKGSEK
ncbi:hypothetical protein CRYUN_Cryun22dG0015100 [Craigia yunnanensis]